MTTNRVTLAELANQEERDRKTREAIRVRDELVKKVFREFNLRRVGDRTPIADAVSTTIATAEDAARRIFTATHPSSVGPCSANCRHLA